MKTHFNFEVGKAYTFSVYPSTILPNVYDHVICSGVYTFKLAHRFIDILSIHAKVYPYLPSGTPDDATQYDYVEFIMQDGSTSILGIPYINIDTIRSASAQKIIVELSDVTSADIHDIREALLNNGYSNFKIKVIKDEPANTDHKLTKNTFFNP